MRLDVSSILCVAECPKNVEKPGLALLVRFLLLPMISRSSGVSTIRFSTQVSMYVAVIVSLFVKANIPTVFEQPFDAFCLLKSNLWEEIMEFN